MIVTFHKHDHPAFEVVERKGIGHPDTLADGISEAISRELCRFYLDEFGEILHHNVDKVLIVGGRAKPCFGGGEIIEPPAVVVGGRATPVSGDSLDAIVERAAAGHISATVKHLESYRIEPRTREGSPELRSLMGQGANDTSIGVGFAPLNEVEEGVLELERRLLGLEGVGEDTKVMAVRVGDDLKIIVAAAMVSRYIDSMESYLEAKERVRDAALSVAEAEVAVNAADRDGQIFLTVTGTSAEMGDDGATGRGNRGCGLITPMRPMTMEAIAGKNPVSHVGKIYNVLAKRAAREIAELDGVVEAYVTLVSKIGAPLTEPLLRGARIIHEDERSPVKEGVVEAITDYWLGEASDIAEDFVAGRLDVY